MSSQIEFPVYYITTYRDNQRYVLLDIVKRDELNNRLWTTDVNKGLSFYIKAEADQLLKKEFHGEQWDPRKETMIAMVELLRVEIVSRSDEF